jgi:hypothetical protein
LLVCRKRTAIVRPQCVEHDLVHREGLALVVVRQVVQLHSVEWKRALERIPDYVFGRSPQQGAERLEVEVVQRQPLQILGEQICRGWLWWWGRWWRRTRTASAAAGDEQEQGCG